MNTLEAQATFTLLRRLGHQPTAPIDHQPTDDEAIDAVVLLAEHAHQSMPMQMDRTGVLRAAVRFADATAEVRS